MAESSRAAKNLALKLAKRHSKKAGGMKKGERGEKEEMKEDKKMC